MTKVLKADNRETLKDREATRLKNNYPSGASSIEVKNASGLSSGDFLLLSGYGFENSELVEISSIANDTLTLSSATNRAHTESSSVVKLKYDQVEFYQTSDNSFSTSNLLSTEDIQADEFYTRYEDTSNSSGFGWYRFKNSNTSNTSSEYGPIPYDGFATNSVKRILDDFYSNLNQEEESIVSQSEALYWLNDAYSRAMNALNMINEEWSVELTTITVSSGTQEYDLPTDFKSIEAIHQTEGYDTEIPYVEFDEVLDDFPYTFNKMHYYIRGMKIGFVPTPTSSEDVKIYYKTNASYLDSLADTIDLPNNEHYMLVQWMLHRAGPKLGRPNNRIQTHRKNFETDLQKLKLQSYRSNNQNASWDPDPTTVV